MRLTKPASVCSNERTAQRLREGHVGDRGGMLAGQVARDARAPSTTSMTIRDPDSMARERRHKCALCLLLGERAAIPRPARLRFLRGTAVGRIQGY
jgi:hypothetical protein